jgi:hypothetical protein
MGQLPGEERGVHTSGLRGADLFTAVQATADARVANRLRGIPVFEASDETPQPQ